MPCGYFNNPLGLSLPEQTHDTLTIAKHPFQSAQSLSAQVKVHVLMLVCLSSRCGTCTESFTSFPEA
eukprot:4803341-Amphidinium_carterae.1